MQSSITLKIGHREDGIKLFPEQKDEMQQLQVVIIEINVRYEEKKIAVVAAEHWNRHPECLWNLYLTKISELSWIRS